MSSEQQGGGDAPIVAKAGKYYRVTRYVMAFFVFGWGIWSIYDGFYSWPQKKEEAIAAGNKSPHTDMDIFLNKLLGVVLPPAAVAGVIWTLYRSRGRYRLADNVLSVPGHPDLPLEQIRKIDKRLWDRKGIAIIEYEVPGGDKRGRLRLDDFIYERQPTDEIFQRIERYLLPPSEEPVKENQRAAT